MVGMRVAKTVSQLVAVMADLRVDSSVVRKVSTKAAH